MALDKKEKAPVLHQFIPPPAEEGVFLVPVSDKSIVRVVNMGVYPPKYRGIASNIYYPLPNLGGGYSLIPLKERMIIYPGYI